MRWNVLTAVLVLFAGAGITSAQTVTFGTLILPEADTLNDAPTMAYDPGETPPARAWFSIEYLLWWIRSGPLAAPLVTSGSPADAVPGALGQPGTVPFQNSSLHFGNTSGIRLSGGIAVSDAVAVEASYFLLEERSTGFAAASDAGGTVVIARPVINAQTFAESAYTSAFPGSVSGGTAVTGQSRLQGYDLNLSANLYRDAVLRFDALGGFRSLYLNESLTISDIQIPAVPGFVNFMGAPVDALTPVIDLDRFRTHNAFYGGQLGGRLTWQEDEFGVSIVGGVALGATQQLALIEGRTVVFAPGAPPVATVGGILAQPSNIGRWYHTTFSVVPEVGLDFSYQITPRLRASIGYTLVFWTGVARPGNQIDRTVNPSQVPIDPTFGQGGGPARPAPPPFHESDFWAQGISLGLAFSY
jgi:hypothetical protein